MNLLTGLFTGKRKDIKNKERGVQMENFVLIEGTQTLASSREQINNALLSVRSLSSGTSFPVSNLVDGMLCYRSDKGMLYQYSASKETWTNELNITVPTATEATVAAKCSGNATTASLADVATAVTVSSDSETTAGKILFVTGTGNSETKASPNLTYDATTGALAATRLYNAVYNDYAEFFPRGEATEAGDIVALDLESEGERYVKAVKGDIVAGVHSDEYGHIIGGESPKDGKDFISYNLSKYIPVALVGRVHVKVKGIVKRGDYIVASDIPGVGVATAKPKRTERIVGYAIESSSDKDIKKIKMRIV